MRSKRHRLSSAAAVGALSIACASSTEPGFVIRALHGSIPQRDGTQCIGTPVDHSGRVLMVFSTPGCEPCLRQSAAIDRATLPVEIEVHHIVVHEKSCNRARMESRLERAVSIRIMSERQSQAWGFAVSPTTLYAERGQVCRLAVGVMPPDVVSRLVEPCVAQIDGAARSN